MADIVSKAKRSWIMSRIRIRWTRIDRTMHGLLKGYKVTHVMYPRVVGNPDIFVPPGTLIFLDGCFWHHCPKCGRPPKSKLSYWRPKIEANVRRDRTVRARLRRRGYVVLRFWEHEVLRDGRGCARIILRRYKQHKHARTSLLTAEMVHIGSTQR